MTPDDFKAWRKRLGFSQDEAAAALGISRSSVLNYESGTRREDGRPVEIPRAIELACDAVCLSMAAEKHNPMILSDRVRALVYENAYGLSIGASGRAIDGTHRNFDTMHESLQDAGFIPKGEPSLLERLRVRRY